MSFIFIQYIPDMLGSVVNGKRMFSVDPPYVWLSTNFINRLKVNQTRAWF